MNSIYELIRLFSLIDAGMGIPRASERVHVAALRAPGNSRVQGKYETFPFVLAGCVARSGVLARL